MRIDLHIHSRYSSDGVLDPEEIIEIARRRGLDGIAITDHNTVRGGLEAKRHETEDFTVIAGAEVLTEKAHEEGLRLPRSPSSDRAASEGP